MEALSLQESMAKACTRFAPTWPLDRSIAVNPWWEMRAQPFTEVAAKLSVLGNIESLMPGSFYKSQWGNTISSAQLMQARDEMGVGISEAQLVDALNTPVTTKQWQNIVDFLDAMPAQRDKMAWHAEVQQNISQFCGAFFQYPERISHGANDKETFFQSWREVVGLDKGIGILMGAKHINHQIHELPQSIGDIYQAMEDEIFDGNCALASNADYAQSLLLDVNGWTSWLAYQAWQDKLVGKDNDLIEQLLAIRLAWELLLWRHIKASNPVDFERIKREFLAQLQHVDTDYAAAIVSQQALWVWQRASEIAYQQPLVDNLLAATPQPVEKPSIQAAFCIDVRSEPMRRALEAQAPDIQTLGFAGFFGLPIEYQSMFVKDPTPQLPGLLNPAISVSQPTPSLSAHKRHDLLQRTVVSQETFNTAPSTFGLVETSGIFKVFDLLRHSFAKTQTPESGQSTTAANSWELRKNGVLLSKDEKAQLLLSILGAIGLKSNFAEHVLLVGHGSQTANNPHAAGLDCGACGGQSGEVNVRVLSQLLNNPDLRKVLATHNVVIPESTRFVPALHNTCTDEIVCFDSSAQAPYAQWLKDAQTLAQKTRAASVGIKETNAGKIASAFSLRTKDWAQVRPEWALANNAAFIVAPRAHTRQVNLEGRSFLHDYTWQNDDGFSVLELIMTAPMIVTNWINMQYFASVVDPIKFGSGNKLLHNVVGEHIGVFEGNGGDLRIGLPLQSVHDGKQWRHQPLRLSVYIAAPQEAISHIAASHAAVRELIDNDWLYLFAWDLEKNSMARLKHGQWTAVAAGELNG